ncbi:MAG: acyltransferase [bacterium]
MPPSVSINNAVIIGGQGVLDIGRNVVLGDDFSSFIPSPVSLVPFTLNAVIEIGEDTNVMNGTRIIAHKSITVGSNCRLGPGVSILDFDTYSITPQTRSNAPGACAQIVLGENVCVCEMAIILKGVIIGRDSFIGPGAVVIDSIPAGAIAYGNPARVIGSVYDYEDNLAVEKD